MIFFYINWLVLSVSIYLSKILLLHGILSSEFRNVIQLSYLSYVGIQKRYFPNYNLLNILFPIYPIQAFDDQ